MAEDPKDGDKGGDKGGGNGPDESAIRKVVADVLGGLFKSGKADVDDDDAGGKPRRRRSREDDDADIAAQVERALDQVKAKDAKAKEKEALEARLKAIEEKTATPEKVPREVRKVTRWMWGDDDGQ